MYSKLRTDKEGKIIILPQLRYATRLKGMRNKLYPHRALEECAAGENLSI